MHTYFINILLVLVTLLSSLDGGEHPLIQSQQMSVGSGFKTFQPKQNEGPSSLASIENEPTGIVANCVNVISGDYTDQQVDIVVAGTVPLMLTRNYSSADLRNNWLGTGWHFNSIGYLMKLQHKGLEEQFSVCEGSGGHHVYKRKGRRLKNADIIKYSNCHLSHQTYQRAVTNCSSGRISGRTNILNNNLSIDPEGYSCQLFSGSGGIKRFRQSVSDEKCELYLMDKELLPNGNLIRFDFDQFYFPSMIAGKTHYGADVNHLKFDFKRLKPGLYRALIKASDSRTVEYTVSQESFDPKAPWKLMEVNRPNGPPERFKYEYLDKKHPAVLVKKSYPDGHYLKMSYYEKGTIILLMGL